MHHPAIDVPLGGNVDGVGLNKVRTGSVGWDSEDLDICLTDGWFAREPVVEFGEEGSCGFHDLGLSNSRCDLDVFDLFCMLEKSEQLVN